MAQGDVINSATEENIGSTTSNTIALGGTATSGNLLFSTCNWDKDAQASGSPTCRDANGSGDFWTVTYVEASDLTCSSAIAWKISDGDETQCFWSWSQSEDQSVTIYEIEGPFEASPLDINITNSTTSIVTSFAVGPSATLAQASEFAVVCAGMDSQNSGGTSSIDSGDGWTQRVSMDGRNSGDPTHVMGTQKTSATTALTGNFTSSGGDEWAGCLLTWKFASPGPVITNVEDEEIFDGEATLAVTGTDFGTDTGSAKIEIGDNSVYASATKAELDVVSWADTSISVNVEVEGTGNNISDTFHLFANSWIFVTDSSGTTSAGYQVKITTEPEGALNTDLTLEVDTKYIILFRVQNDGGDGAQNFRYAVNHESGGYAAITAASSDVKAVVTGAYTNDDDCDEILTGTGSHIDDNNGLNTDGTFSLAAAIGLNEAFNAGLSFEIVGDDVNHNDTGLIRIEESDGTALDGYTQEFTYTVNKPATGGDGTDFPWEAETQYPKEKVIVIGY